MAEKRAPKQPVQAREPEDFSTGGFATLAQEYEDDKKTMRIAVVIAAVFHAGLLWVTLPDNPFTIPEAKKPKVYVVQQVRFKPPPPQQKQEIPKPKAKKVPIPDPTPDEPEPIRLPEDLEPDLDLPETDIIFDIPDGPPPAEPEGPLMVGGDVKRPVQEYAPPPHYTEIARKARIQGVVIVQAIVTKEGNVKDVKVLKGLPMGLDKAAAEAVEKWRFKPATLNGKPVDVYYNLTVNFTLQ